MYKQYYLIINILLVSIVSYGQTGKGRISGEVTVKGTKETLVGVNVILVNTTLGAITKLTGKFEIKNITPGIYTVKFSMVGYKEVKLTNIMVQENNAPTLKVSLEESPIGMEDVIVTPKPETYDATGISAKLDRRMVTEAPGSAQDIFWVIQTLPGISSGGDDSKLYVRGGSSDENLVLFDGAIIRNPFHFDMLGGGIWSVFNSRLVQNVEFYSGGFPARYGDRLSSVLKIENREANKDKYSGEVNLSMSDVNGILEVPIPLTNGSGVFSVRRSYFDIALKLISDLAGDYSVTPYFFDTYAKMDFNITPKQKITFSGLNSNEEINGYYNEPNFTGKLAFNSQNQLLSTRLVSIFSDQVFSDFNVYDFRYSKNSSYPENAIDNAKDSEFALKEDISVITPNHEVHIGSWWIKKTDELFMNFSPKANFLTFDSLKVNSDGSFALFSFYVEDKWKVNEKLTAGLGLRFDRVARSDENNLSPRLNVAYAWNSHMSFSADYGWYYQSPKAYELGANQNLKSRKAESFGLGVKHQVEDKIIVNLEFYNKKISNLVTMDQNWNFSNNGFGFARGVELYIQLKPVSSFYGWASYSYSVAKRKEGVHYAEHYFNYDRTHLVSLVGNYSFSDLWQMGIKFRYGTGTPYTPAIGGLYDSGRNQWFPKLGVQNSVRYPAYNRLDIRVTRKFNFQGLKVDSYFELLNVLNQQNVIHYIWNGNYTSKDPMTLFPTLPVLGLNIKF